MISDHAQLMQRLQDMQIGGSGASLSFAQRLAQENGWSPAFAARVVDEYRRFLFLAATSDHAVTPSDAVDQAWHLHLTYTRHYWDVLCGQILSRPLHHGPTAGGSDEDARYREQYAQTLSTYAQIFGDLPPRGIWPEPDQRFAERYRRVKTGQHWLVPKHAAYAIGASLALAACTPSDDLIPLGVFALTVIAFLVAAIVRAGRHNAKKKGDGSGCGGGDFSWGSSDNDSSGNDSGGCGGGCGGGD